MHIEEAFIEFKFLEEVEIKVRFAIGLQLGKVGWLFCVDRLGVITGFQE